jgi:lipopolysaccharide export system permease protein
MKILRSYIVKETARPFGGALLIFTFVLVSGNIIRLIELIITKGIPLMDVGRLFFWQIPSLLSYIFPMAILTAILISLGRLSADMEITAMKASGLNIFRLEFPLVLIGISFSLFSIVLNNEIIPYARFASRRLIKQVGFKNPSTYLEPGVFIRDFKNHIVFIYGIQNNKLSNLRIYEFQENLPTRTILARQGEFEVFPERGIIKLKLYDGTSDEPDPKDHLSFYKLNFKTYSLSLNLANKNAEVLEKKPKEMGIGELIEERKNLEKAQIDPYPINTEIQKKLSVSFSCLTFVLVGFPLGIVSRRGNRPIAFGISLLIFTLYYLLLAGGEALALQGMVNPVWSMWLANITISLTGLVLSVYIHKH